jgi:hypothetical protein
MRALRCRDANWLGLIEPALIFIFAHLDIAAALMLELWQRSDCTRRVGKGEYIGKRLFEKG